ncbi:hypothetical protein [Pseudomonas sp. RGM2987]|uniref:hypothetical protein n=1 Tax=Pseudomonas sp. RGM2987 TaxID=2930090 RepID=UPI001FD65FE5|nr:hypothetical protein [Pseudomonas sp. RGM2987]MCJ8207690.1 hypothetical protein [Pseudomonas sp. RGM2987]
MPESSHTPGPWKVVDGYYPGFIKIVGASFEPSIVLSATNLDLADYCRRTADARLMAAAPDLLAAAQKTVDAWAKFIASFDYVPGIGDRAEDMEFREILQLRAAIAKATQ